MLRVITLNVNGIRSAINKGLLQWLSQQNADIICLQEIKAQEHQLSKHVLEFTGYYKYFFAAQKKGYSGVALLCRHKPDALKFGFGWEVADQEGRYLHADFATVRIASLYMPSGSSGSERQAIKFAFLKRFRAVLDDLLHTNKPTIIGGDWNMAHKAIDLKNWRSNQKNPGFLPSERAWMDELLEVAGFVDAFREINLAPDQYTWWSNRGQAWTNNVGWRIDYQIVTPHLKNCIKAASIYTQTRFSDHAPLIVDYDLDL